MKRKITDSVPATKSIEIQAGSAKVNRKTSVRQKQKQQQQQPYEQTHSSGRMTRSKVQSTKGVALHTFVKMVNETVNNSRDVDASMYVTRDVISDDVVSSAAEAKDHTTTTTSKTRSNPRNTTVSSSSSTSNQEQTPQKSTKNTGGSKPVEVDKEASSTSTSTSKSSRNKTANKSIDFTMTTRNNTTLQAEISSNQTPNKCKHNNKIYIYLNIIIINSQLASKPGIQAWHSCLSHHFE